LTTVAYAVDTMIKSFSSKSSKVIVELGMGDGRLLEKLAKCGGNIHSNYYIGIELDKQQYKEASRRINLVNIGLLNGSFEDIVPMFPNDYFDLVIAVLPDPDFIDILKQHKWQLFYKVVYSKLKNHGSFQLITELTDELLQPISDKVYYKWVEWLSTTFQSMGFVLLTKEEGAPSDYSTRCLDQFRGDPERIRMITLTFGKSVVIKLN
jgi:cyclopropane fatty-acyl-phospholipid synthase-like methyltransferase